MTANFGVTNRQGTTKQLFNSEKTGSNSGNSQSRVFWRRSHLVVVVGALQPPVVWTLEDSRILPCLGRLQSKHRQAISHLALCLSKSNYLSTAVSTSVRGETLWHHRRRKGWLDRGGGCAPRPTSGRPQARGASTSPPLLQLFPNSEMHDIHSHSRRREAF